VASVEIEHDIEQRAWKQRQRHAPLVWWRVNMTPTGKQVQQSEVSFVTIQQTNQSLKVRR
jgi:hypothetical protein